MTTTESFERALDLLLRYKPEVIDLATSLTTEHPDFAMGNALMAYLCLTATDVPELAAARRCPRADDRVVDGRAGDDARGGDRRMARR